MITHQSAKDIFPRDGGRNISPQNIYLQFFYEVHPSKNEQKRCQKGLFPSHFFVFFFSISFSPAESKDTKSLGK